MGDFGRLSSASLWKSGPLFSTGTKEAELMVRELRVEPTVVRRRDSNRPGVSDEAGKVGRGVGPRLSTVFAERDGRSSPGACILIHNRGCASGQGEMM
jgi:hypothetical protein